MRALVANRGQGDLEASCRAAGVLLHILKDNAECKERVSADGQSLLFWASVIFLLLLVAICKANHIKLWSRSKWGVRSQSPHTVASHQTKLWYAMFKQKPWKARHGKLHLRTVGQGICGPVLHVQPSPSYACPCHCFASERFLDLQINAHFRFQRVIVHSRGSYFVLYRGELAAAFPCTGSSCIGRHPQCSRFLTTSERQQVCPTFLQVLKIPLEIPASDSSSSDLLLPRCLRYLSSASTFAAVNGTSAGSSAWLPAVFLRLLVTWLNNCPPAVAAFLASPAHLPLVGEPHMLASPAIHKTMFGIKSFPTSGTVQWGDSGNGSSCVCSQGLRLNAV